MSTVRDQPTPSTDPRGGDWLPEWNPEDERFWNEGGRRIANRTLAITTASLLCAFAVWFVVSALISRLGKVGFSFSTTEMYWLVAMPGLAAGTLRLIHTFLTPIYGTRKVVSISTALLLIPLVGWYAAVQDLSTPYWIFLALAFLAGLGGGNFSSFMPSTSLFFPKKKLGTALATQAGIGNFGVSLVQFLTPIVITFAIVGSPQVFKKKPTAPGTDIYLQNAVLIWMLPVLVLAVIAWFGLRSVPVRANVREQMDIFREKNTYTMTSLYVMTFGAFSGLAAAFPILIDKRFGGFPDAPDPLRYAFIGPLVGSIMRVVAGPISDRIGGARLTLVAGVGMLVFCVLTALYVSPTSMDDFTPFVLCMVGVFFFAGIGNASTFKQIPMLFPARKSAGVVGWTAAIAAYGPFLVSVLIALATSSTGSPAAFFYGLAAFCLFNVGLCWWFFARPRAPYPC